MESETICHYCGEILPHEKCSEAKKPEPTDPIVRTLIQGLRNEIDRLSMQRDYKDKAIKRLRKKQKNQAKAINFLVAKLTAKDDVLRKIKDWCRAYPLEVFPKPDKEYFAKANAILKQNELSLTRISADNMRHVLVGIQKIIEGEAKDV